MSALKANVDMPVVSASGGLLWRVSHWVQYDAGVGPPANALARPRVRLGVRNGATARLSFFEPESPALRTALARRGLKSENPFLRRTNGSCLTEMPTRRWLSLVMFEVRENLSGARREGLFLVSLPPPPGRFCRRKVRFLREIALQRCGGRTLTQCARRFTKDAGATATESGRCIQVELAPPYRRANYIRTRGLHGKLFRHQSFFLTIWNPLASNSASTTFVR
jgi:hypothetical protein